MLTNVQKPVPWDDDQEYRVYENPLLDHIKILHKGIVVEASSFEILKELDTWQYVPKFYIAPIEEKRRLLAKALWQRLQLHTYHLSDDS